MFIRSASIFFGLLLSTAMVSEAFADHRPRRRVIIEDRVYAPEFFVRIPGVRTLFGDYALTEEEYNALYGPDTRNFDESYYEPEPAQPPKRRAKPPMNKPPMKKAARQDGTDDMKIPAPRPAKPQVSSRSKTGEAAPSKSGSASQAGKAPAANSAPATKSASASGSATAKSVSCEKATGIVAGYGFSAVTAQSCSGKLYAFNASRGGKNFAIKLDPASGELTEVKKLQ
jgi:hypothetical protein